MDIDWGAYPYGADRAAHLDHLMRCTECGPTGCSTAGADLCSRYRATPHAQGSSSWPGARCPVPGARCPVPGAGRGVPR